MTLGSPFYNFYISSFSLGFISGFNNHLINIKKNISREIPKLAQLYSEYIGIFIVKILGYFWGVTRLADFETVNLTEECSAILQRKLPQKLKDPGSFTIPCTIGNAIFERALCDLGASINLMPLSIFKRLGLGEARPTTVTLQLADRSLKHPRGVIEDVLVKVDKFIFPADFIVLDMEEDKEIPIILGRPFLATGRAMIDVQRGELKLRVQEEEVKFNVFEAVRHPAESDTCFMDEMVEAVVSSQSGLTDPLETSLVENEPENLSEEAQEYVKWMDSFGHNRRK